MSGLLPSATPRIWRNRLAGLLSMNDISCKPSTAASPEGPGAAPEAVREGKLQMLVATDVAAGAWTSTMWTWCSTTTYRRNRSTTSTGSAVPGRAKRHGVAYTFVVTVTEAIQMDEIVKHQHYDVQTLKFDEDGCLMLVEPDET